jgi:hypothetical protein
MNGKHLCLDPEWADVHRQIDEDAAKHKLTDMDAVIAWKLGLAAWKTARKYKAKYPHDP